MKKALLLLCLLGGVSYLSHAQNVGIGTSLPGQKLHVAGNLKLDGAIVEGNSSFRVYNNLATFNSSISLSPGAFVITTAQPWNSATMFTVKVSGYFYDNTGPFELTVGGYIYTTNTFYNYGYTNTGGKKLNVRLARNNTTNTVAIILGDEGATYEYPKLNVTSFTQGHSSINEAYADGWTIVQTTSLANYSFITTVPDVTNSTAGGGWVDNGSTVTLATNGDNVGIGTSSPGQKLDVNGRIRIVSDQTELYQSGTRLFIRASGIDDVAEFADYGIYLPKATTYGMYAGGGMQLDYTMAGYDLSFRGSVDHSIFAGGTGGVDYEMLRFINGGNVYAPGNVGIGTASPGAKLHVYGTTSGPMIVQSSSTESDINYINSAGGNWQVGTNNSGNGTGSNHFFIYDNAYRLTVQAGTGNVGVGTTAPAVKLAVNGAGLNVYSTDAWIENNLHTQGSETLTQGGRGRMRVGTAWGYVGLYAEPSSTAVNNDLVLGSSSGVVRIGSDGGNQRLYSNWNTKTAGTGDIYHYNSGNVSAGTGYGAFSASAGVWSYSYWGNTYDFAVAGYSYNDYVRSGGLIGSNSGGTSWSSLGYKASNSTTYGLYYTNAATGAGYLPQGNTLSGVGAGGTGEFIGSWSKGGVFGNINSGDLAAAYNVGNVYTSGQQIEIVNTGNQRVATYSNSSTEATISKGGKAQLVKGTATISFDATFASLLAKNEEPIVTVTPVGNCNGIHLVSVSSQGFTVEENNGGASSVPFTWMVMGKRIDAGSTELPANMANKDFDENLKGFMFNEANTEQSAKPMWWDGTTVRFDPLPANPAEKKPYDPKKWGAGIPSPYAPNK